MRSKVPTTGCKDQRALALLCISKRIGGSSASRSLCPLACLPTPDLLPPSVCLLSLPVDIFPMASPRLLVLPSDVILTGGFPDQRFYYLYSLFHNGQSLCAFACLLI